jgi:hypothetical protein
VSKYCRRKEGGHQAGQITLKKEDVMARFYDPKDDADLARVEALLQKGGIEFFVSAAPAGAGTTKQIEVAEEDVPKAEELLVQGAAKR